jgi:hypothetical protein
MKRPDRTAVFIPFLFLLLGHSAAAQPPAVVPASNSPVQSDPGAQEPGVRPGGIAIGDAVRVGGYASIRFESNSLDGSKPAGFDFRRFVLTTDVAPNDRLRAYMELEFERFGEIELERSITRSTGGSVFKEGLEGGSHGEISIEQMWGQYAFGKSLSARIGAILPPIGRFNIAHDDDRWNLPRRSLVDRGAPVLPVHAAWSELGAGVVGSAGVGSTGRVTYEAFVVNGTTLDFSIEKAVEAKPGEPSVVKLATEFSLARGPVNGTGGARAGTWRLGYSPTLGSEIAVSGYHGRYTPDFLAPVAERINALGADGLFRRGGFVVEGEFIRSDFGDTNRVIQAFVDTVTGPDGIAPPLGAAGTETEFAIKDLTRARQGFWIEARYGFWPEAWRNGLLGKGFEHPQLTPVFRYERITLQDAIDEVAVEGGKIKRADRQTLRQERTTFGLSYRPVGTVVFSIAVEHNRRLDGDVLVFPRGAGASSYTSVLAGMALGF